MSLNRRPRRAARLGLMEGGLLRGDSRELVEPVTVEVNAEGTGSGTFDHIEGGAPVTLETVSLSPLSIQMEYSFADADGDASPAFLPHDRRLLLRLGQIGR